MGTHMAPAEQRELKGQRPGRDSGGRLLPETVAELPTAGGVPQVPDTLWTGDDATTCSYRPLEEGKQRRKACPVCKAEVAASRWREMWTHGQQWLSVQRDSSVLERLCLGYVEEAHLRAALRVHGPITPGQRGGWVAHPAVAQLRNVETLVTKLEGLLGFNPSDGGRLGIRLAKARGATAAEGVAAQRAARRAGRTAQRPTGTDRTTGTD